MPGPYRIVKPTRIRAEDAGAEPVSLKVQDYVGRLIRLVPADVVAAYLTIRNLFLPNDGGNQDAISEAVLGWWLPIGGLVLTIASRIVGSRRAGADVQWLTVLLASIAYCVWVINIGDEHVLGLDLDTRIRAAILISVTVLAPLIQQGDLE